MFDYFDFNNKLWLFLSLNYYKIYDLIEKKNIEIDFNKKIYKYYDVYGSDVIELIDILYMDTDIYGSINRFFTSIKENNFISFANIKNHNEIIGANSYLLTYILPELRYNEKLNMFVMPEYNTLFDKFASDIIKRYSFIFPDLPIYEGCEFYLHTTASNIVTGVTIKTSKGFITNNASYSSKIYPYNIKNTIDNIFNKKDINLIVDSIREDSISVFMGTSPDNYDFSIIEGNSVNLDTSKHNKLNFVFQTNINQFSKLKIKGEDPGKYIFNYIKAYKGWIEKIKEIESIIVNMSSEEFEWLITNIESKISKKTAAKIKQIRAVKTIDLFKFLDIELKAVKNNNFFNSNEVICKINDFYESLPLSENGRNSFVNKVELIEQVKKIKGIFDKLNSVSEKEILNMVFNQIKVESKKLPVLDKILFDGVYENEGTYSLVSKNEFYNIDILFEKGYFPVGKFCALKGKRIKTLSTLINRTPTVLSDYYISIIKLILGKTKNVIINVKTESDAKKVVKHFIESSGLIKYIPLDKINDMSKKMHNSRVPIITINNNGNSYICENIDSIEFLGNKKEYGIEYEIKRDNPIITININEKNGIETKDLNIKARGLLDAFLRYIIDSQKPNLRLKYIIDNLEERAFN